MDTLLFEKGVFRPRPVTLATSIDDIVWPGPTNRIRRRLAEYGIKTIGDLCQHTEKDLRAIPYFAKKSVAAVKEVLSNAGLSLITRCPHCGAPIDHNGRAVKDKSG